MALTIIPQTEILHNELMQPNRISRVTSYCIGIRQSRITSIAIDHDQLHGLDQEPDDEPELKLERL